MKIRGNIRRLLNKINDNDLKKIYNIVEKYDGEETKMLPR
jgi:hypothetical protein